MPGVQYVGKGSGMPDPLILPYPVAKSMTGAGTPPAAAVKAEDLIVSTTNSSLVVATGSPVTRMLLGTDKTAHYKQGTPVAGLLGVAMDDFTTDSSGVGGPAAKPGGPGSFQYQFSNPGLWGSDSSGYTMQRVLVFQPGYRFKARLDLNATDFSGAITILHQFDNQLAGLAISVSSGVTTYRVQAPTGGQGVVGGQGAAAADECIVIIGPDTSDPLYNTAITASGALGAGAQGPFMIFEVIPTFCQYLTGVQYSSQ